MKKWERTLTAVDKSHSDMELQAAYEADRQEWERLAPLAEEIARTGFLEALFEEYQARLVQRWLMSDDQDTRERCWHECRALEEMRAGLAERLAEPGSEQHEKMTATTWGWRRWRKLFTRGT